MSHVVVTSSQRIFCSFSAQCQSFATCQHSHRLLLMEPAEDSFAAWFDWAELSNGDPDPPSQPAAAAPLSPVLQAATLDQLHLPPPLHSNTDLHDVSFSARLLASLQRTASIELAQTPPQDLPLTQAVTPAAEQQPTLTAASTSILSPLAALPLPHGQTDTTCDALTANTTISPGTPTEEPIVSAPTSDIVPLPTAKEATQPDRPNQPPFAAITPTPARFAATTT
jgi:hypothetical protein